MSFLNRMMASVGIGSARVDTRLASAQVRAGDEVEGVVLIQGGSLSQQIESISLHVMTQYLREVDDRRVRENAVIGRFPVTQPFTVGAGGSREFPFRFTLPEGTPATMGQSQVWLKTGVDIAMAVDPTDNDALQVLPHRHAQPIHDAMAALGFRLRKVDTEYSRRLGGGLPFVQEFEYVPTTQFRGRFDEVELVTFPHAGGVDLLLEVDRRARGLMGFFESAYDLDERHLRVQFGREHLAQGVNALAGYLTDILSRHAG